MEQFYVIVITTVVVLLIVILTYIYVYVINDDDKKIKFPPTENKCPDNWEENEHGHCVIPDIDHSNFSQIAKNDINRYSQQILSLGYGFYDSSGNKTTGTPYSIDFSGVKTCSEGGKQRFTRVLGISWDGVSNNSCKI